MRNRLQEDFFNINADNIFRWMRISLILKMHIFFLQRLVALQHFSLLSRERLKYSGFLLNHSLPFVSLNSFYSNSMV